MAFHFLQSFLLKVLRYPPEKRSICPSFWKSSLCGVCRRAVECVLVEGPHFVAVCCTFICKFYASQKMSKFADLLKVFRWMRKCQYGIRRTVLLTHAGTGLKDEKVLQGSSAEINYINWLQKVGIITGFHVLFATFLCLEEFCHQYTKVK